MLLSKHASFGLSLLAGFGTIFVNLLMIM